MPDARTHAAGLSSLSSASPTGARRAPQESIAGGASSALNFGPLRFAGHANWFVRDDITAAQVVISETPADPVRFITAFPAGNTGALTYFHALSPTLGITLTKAESVAHGDQRGVGGELSVSGDARLGTTVLGSVRTIREVVEDGMETDLTVRITDAGEGRVRLTRTWLDGTVQHLALSAGANARVEVGDSEPSVTITRVDPARDATLRFESTFNGAATSRGLGMADLFADGADSEADTEVLAAIRAAPGVVNQLAFLAYETEFLAGGWRFLTYFGRDTLLAMQVLLPVLSPAACEGILAGVIRRTGPDGELCHEETIGDYASLLNARAGHPERGSAPVYDYKMVDTDFLLLPALAAYSAKYPARARAFMARESKLVPGSFAELVRRNAARVLALARPFALAPERENLIRFKKEAWPFGNWRDSAAGNGWGNCPFDVNCAMVSAALRAIVQLAPDLLEGLEGSADALAWADVWEDRACALFALPSPSPAEAEARLQSYLAVSNLSPSLLHGAGSLNGSASTSHGWGDPAHIVGAGAPLYALALSDGADPGPVAVQHSDLAFALLYSPTVPGPLIRATIEALQPYPRGLLTNVGMLVANAAYATPEAAATFSNRAYHGAVAWSWQQAWMAAGVARQLALCDGAGEPPEWCDELGPALRDAEGRLWDAIAGSKEVIWTEVWSPVPTADGVFAIGDLGAMSVDGNEGDAVQLWSYAFLALRDPRTGRPVAAGFE